MAIRLVVSLFAVSALAWLSSIQAGVTPVARAAFPGGNGKIALVRPELIGGTFEPRIWTMEADGTSAARIATGKSPRWSPDGSRIAFVASNDVHVMNSDGSGVVRLSQDGAGYGGLAWSPGGNEVAAVQFGGTIEIIDVTGNTSSQRSVAPQGGVVLDAFSPISWSPDGTSILFTGVTAAAGYELYAIDPNGAAQRQVTSSTQAVSTGDWSPDGNQIVYAASDGIYLADANGANAVRILAASSVRWPSWSPDGNKVIYADASSLCCSTFVINRDGTDRYLLAEGDLPDWQPLAGIQVEFTQAIQDLQSTVELKADIEVDGEPPVPIVEGKPLAMRVYLPETEQAKDYTLEVTGAVNQTKHVTHPAGCTVADQRRQNLGCSSVDFFFTPPQGQWSVNVVVKDFSGSVIEEEEFRLTSLDTPGLVVKYLPICVKLAPGAQATCPSSSVDTAAGLMRKLFPVAEDELRYSRLPIPGMVLAAPLSTVEESAALVAAIRLRYELMTYTGGYTADQVAGWLPPGGAVILGISDPVWLGSTGRVSWQVDTSATDPLDPQFTLAHEIGHNLGLRHTNLLDGCGAQDPSTDWPYTDSTIQEVGFDVEAGIAVLESKRDVMSYCSPPGTNIWISPHSYNKLARNYLQPSSTMMASVGQLGRYLVVSGKAAADGSSGSVESAYVVTSSIPAEPSDPAGNHCLRLTGGQVLEYCFTLGFEEHRSHEPMDYEWFTLRVPLPVGTERVALMRGGRELAALEATASAPSLTVSEPAAGSVWSGEETVSWSASDADGGPLRFAVLYSSDGGNSWLPIGVDVQESQLMFDTGDLEGDEILIRVLASDGLNTTEATTPPIRLSRGYVVGDVDCNGAVNSIDALKLLRAVSGLDVSQGDACPGIGAGDADVFGDVNCDASITSVDALLVLRFVASLPVNPPNGCREMGT